MRKLVFIFGATALILLFQNCENAPQDELQTSQVETVSDASDNPKIDIYGPGFNAQPIESAETESLKTESYVVHSEECDDGVQSEIVVKSGYLKLTRWDCDDVDEDIEPEEVLDEGSTLVYNDFEYHRN